MTRSRSQVSSAAGAAGTSAGSTLKHTSAHTEHNTPTQQQVCKQSLISTPGLDEGERHKDQRTRGTFARTSLTFHDSPDLRDRALSLDTHPDS
ncbi:uncharacterized protein LOC133655191 [Entelurus aequoreus]|uniref:uncharacterized protein LOC133655191 n=1 Tax=Entelurus aequoreus TaxID=161455 RepID=UPI002B1E69D9|nr:uncharacterized protein LOC133655191 [Entelurus aequoreus]